MSKPTLTSHSSGFDVINPADIFWPERMRRNSPSVLSHIEELSISISKHGLIQPVVIFFDSANDNRPTGVAGWCRTQASLKLSLDSVPFVLRQNLSPDVAKALELEENLRRKDMTWQEKILGIYETHMLKVKLSAIDYKTWGQRETGAVLGIKASHVNHAICLAEAMLAGETCVLEASTIDEADKALLAKQQDLAAAILAEKAGVKLTISSAVATKGKRSGPVGTSLDSASTNLDVDIDPALFADLIPTRSDSEHNKAKVPATKNTVELSKMLFNVSCHDWFNQAPAKSIDLIYTDIPFGIDMANLETIDGVDLVAHAHEVEENVEQMSPFLKGAFKVLKPDSFLLFFYDLKHHEKLFNWATEAGFKVQEWPVVWIKTHSCKNNAPQYNWTKATEYVMCCRKGSPTLRKPQLNNYIAANGKAEKQMQRNPFAKPFDFSKQLLDPVIIPGMTVLDCYAGGGSLLRACINLGCRVIGLEKDPAQFPHLQESIKQTFKSMLRGEVEFV